MIGYAARLTCKLVVTAEPAVDRSNFAPFRAQVRLLFYFFVYSGADFGGDMA